MTATNPLPESVSLGPLERELDRFASEAVAVGASTETVLRHARVLLVRIRDRPALDTPFDENSDAGEGWQGVRTHEQEGEVEITSWKEPDGDVLLRAVWQDGTLVVLQVYMGDRAWETRLEPTGQAIFDSDPAWEDPATRSRMTDLPRRMREELRKWNEATATHRRRCPRCVWEAEEGETVCSICGASLAATEDEVRDRPHATSQIDGPPLPDTPSTATMEASVMELPESFAEVLDDLASLPGRVLETVEKVSKAAGPTFTVGFDVILQRCDPAHKASVITAVRDVLATSNDGAVGLAEASALVDRAPSVVRPLISAAEADRARKTLEKAGAIVEVRRRES